MQLTSGEQGNYATRGKLRRKQRQLTLTDIQHLSLLQVSHMRATQEHQLTELNFLLVKPNIQQSQLLIHHIRPHRIFRASQDRIPAMKQIHLLKHQHRTGLRKDTQMPLLLLIPG